MKGPTAKAAVIELQLQMQTAQQQQRKAEEAIAAIRAVCQHEMVDNGHDSHYNWMICKYCGFEERDG